MKKKFDKPQIIVAIPVVLGFILLVAGIATGTELVYVGIGILFGGSFLAALIISIVAIVQTLKDNGSSDGKTAAEREERQLNEINSTYGYENQMANAKHQISHIKHAYKNSDRKAMVGGCLFVAAFIGCAIGGVILLSLELIIPGVIVFVSAFALVIGLLIVTKIKEHMSLSQNYNKNDYIEERGIVKGCSMSSSTSRGNRYSSRITNIVYCVHVEVNGNVYVAYSHKYYSEGSTILVLKHKTRNIVKILESDIDQTFADDYDDYDDIADDYDNDYDRDYDEYEDSDTADDDDYEEKLAAYDLLKAERKTEARKKECYAQLIALLKARSKMLEQQEKARQAKEASASVLKAAPEPKSEEAESSATKRGPNVGYKGIQRKK